MSKGAGSVERSEGTLEAAEQRVEWTSRCRSPLQLRSLNLSLPLLLSLDLILNLQISL